MGVCVEKVSEGFLVRHLWTHGHNTEVPLRPRQLLQAWMANFLLASWTRKWLVCWGCTHVCSYLICSLYIAQCFVLYSVSYVLFFPFLYSLVFHVFQSHELCPFFGLWASSLLFRHACGSRMLPLVSNTCRCTAPALHNISSVLGTTCEAPCGVPATPSPLTTSALLKMKLTFLIVLGTSFHLSWSAEWWNRIHILSNSWATCAVSPVSSGGLSISILTAACSLHSHEKNRGAYQCDAAWHEEYHIFNNSEEPNDTLTQTRNEPRQSKRWNMRPLRPLHIRLLHFSFCRALALHS